MQLFVVANWKFSVIAGWLVSLLAVLYLAAIAFSVFRAARRLLRFGPLRDDPHIVG